ncbi:AraC family transcriptional regulator [Sphingobacterium psychroaquaticum]|uniref:AraC family transcriptional regulator n=1 Tax=Sphingobacterium psychroaquaticum TaxID=561061 RepID=UPI00106CA7F3|nr:AraC family transcriptional regulator [Sphingobacterium psychroaquaticum]QBQ40451.1 AraC family transcriptional regulator [Sphingobacterium psychroaquaticum]
MSQNHLLQQLPLSTKGELDRLVENKRAFTLRNFELNIFETYEASEQIPLQFNDLVIINMLKGKKVMHLQDKVSFDYHPGETLLLPEYTPMRIDFPEAQLAAPTQCTAISIGADKIGEVVQYLNEFYPKKSERSAWSFQLDKFHFSNNDELVRLTNRLFQVSLSTDIHKEALADLVLKELMIRIMQTQGLLVLDTDTKNNSTPFTYLKSYIRQNIGEKISLDTLAAEAGMSKSALSRAFKTELGVSPVEYVIRERIAYAKQVLQQSKSVKIACFSAGFSDINYFVRLFKQREGITPGRYIMMF